MSQLLSDVRAGGGIITAVVGGNNITVNTVAGVATVNVSGTTNHAVQVGNALGALTSLALGTAGQVLTSNGAGVDPSFQNFPGTLIQTITGNTGGPESPSAGNFNFLTAHATVKFAGSAATETLDFGLSNLVLGSVLPSIISGSQNTGVGDNVLNGITSGLSNTAVGFQAAQAMATGSGNVAIGQSALTTAVSGDHNIAIGVDALELVNGGSDNIAIGNLAGSALTTDTFTIAIGSQALSTRAGGTLPDIAIGEQALKVYNGLGANIAIGTSALAALVSTITNTVVGNNSCTSFTTAGPVTAFGPQNFQNALTGAGLIAFGSGNGNSYTGSESNNILIGNGVTGTLGESNVLRIGQTTGGSGSGALAKAFIHGIDGVNVGSVAKVVTMASDQLGTATITAGTNISVTTGANTITIAALGGGAVAWSVISANQTAAVNNGYFANKAGTLALALPTTSAVGDVIEVSNENTATGIQFTQAAGQQILLPNNTSTTLGATGTLTSSAIGDTIKLVCKTANTIWRCVSMNGNWTPV